MNIPALVEELNEIRQIPQFLFLSGIDPSATVEVRAEILEFKKNNPDTKSIDFIINSPGGSPSDAYRIIRTLRNNFEEVNIIVPFWAKSAATLLALGGNNIIMDEFGEFGPLDIQIGVEREDSPEFNLESALNDEYSVRQIETRSQESFYQMFMNLYKNEDIKINKNDLSKQILEYLTAFYEPLLRQINPYSLGKKKRLLDIGESYAQRILLTYNTSLNERDRDVLVDFLVNRCPEHGYVVDYNILKTILNNVKCTSEIGIKYEETIRSLTTELLSLQSNQSFIGFISPKEGNSNKDVKVPPKKEHFSEKPVSKLKTPTNTPQSKNGKHDGKK